MKIMIQDLFQMESESVNLICRSEAETDNIRNEEQIMRKFNQ
jgi:hypothetical protein